jgi:hypothetical protein
VKKLLVLLVAFGVLPFTLGCPSGDKDKDKPPKPTPPVATVDDAQLDAKEITLAPGDNKDVKVLSGKELQATVKPADSKVKATVKDDKTLTVEASADEKDGTVTVTVKGKGKGVDLKVMVKTKEPTPPAKEPVKLDKTEIDVKEGDTAEVKVSEGKIASVKVLPTDSKVKATMAEDGKSVKVDAKDAKEKDTGTVMVTGVEGKAELKVTVIKK